MVGSATVANAAEPAIRDTRGSLLWDCVIWDRRPGGFVPVWW